MRSRRDGTDPGLLFDGANELKDNPQDEDRPCRQPDPSEPYKSPSHQELDTCLRKIECVNVITPAMPPLAPMHGVCDRGSRAIYARSPTNAASAISMR